MDIKTTCGLAKQNSTAISLASEKDMNNMLSASIKALTDNADYILSENLKDVKLCTRNQSFIDRLTLTKKRIEDICKSYEQLIAQKTPVGEIIETRKLDCGLDLTKVRVALGVVGVIYEARPNVTADVIALCIKSGNAVVLRGSKDAYNSNLAIVKVIKKAISDIGYNSEFIQLIEDTTREGATEFMRMNGLIDVIIPRGSASLIQNAVQNATVPIIETGSGNCHIYVENSADIDMAIKIIINAKVQRPSVCNSCESLIFDEEIAKTSLQKVVDALKEQKVEVRGCEKAVKYAKGVVLASDEDFYTEYNDLIISVKILNGIDEAISFINSHSTHHSEAIITKNKAFADKFLKEIDSSSVYVNASTRFTDGGVFGLGAEVGISTQKLHARGPMGITELTSYKYCLKGNGEIR